MELGEFRSAVGELSQLLTQAIVVPFRRKRARQTRPVRPEAARAPTAPLGWLVVAGGGRLPDDLVVEMIHRAGGRRAKAAVVPAAHLDPVWAGERYVRYLTRFGMQDIDVVDLSTRERASNPTVTAPLDGAELILLGGGDGQLLLDCVAGTAAADALREAHRRGAVVASVGGAAAASGDVAIAWRGAGEPAGSTPRATDVEVRPGLGLLPGCLVDRQGVQRGQVGRLFFAVAGTPAGEGRRGPLSRGVPGSVPANGAGAAPWGGDGGPAVDGTGDLGTAGTGRQTSVVVHGPARGVPGAFGRRADLGGFTRPRPGALAVGRHNAPGGWRLGQPATPLAPGTGSADTDPAGTAVSRGTPRAGSGAPEGGPSPWAGAAAGDSDRTADGLLGIGLDEETALLVEPGWQAEVWGAGVVMLIDGRTASPSRPAWAGAPPALTGVTVHVLPHGWRLDLRARHAYPPDAARTREGH